MEQRLKATYLRTGWLERAAGIGIICIGLGAAVFLVVWGVSFVWRYTPPEIAVRIANPEVHLTQTEPLIVTQDKPFTIAPPEPLRIDSRDLVTRVQQDTKPTSGTVITREVTVFSNLSHAAGFVTTGWTYN